MPDRQYIFVSDLVWMLYPLYLAACLASLDVTEDDRIMYAITRIKFRYKVLVGLVWFYFASTLPLWLAKVVLFKACWTNFLIFLTWLVFGPALSLRRLKHITESDRTMLRRSAWVMIALCLVATWLDLT